MPSIVSHAIAGGALARTFGLKGGKLLALAALSAMVPDADALGFFAGVPYDSLFGHRGFTHSICFAALWAGLVTWLFFRREERWPWIAFMLFLAAVSHPLLDMLTNGGLGVALFSPLSNERFFFPWRPIKVAPISVTGFFTERGWAVLKSEVVCVWLPSAVLVILPVFFRRWRR